MDNAQVISWLLSSSEPWVVYNTLVDLVGARRTAPQCARPIKPCRLTGGWPV